MIEFLRNHAPEYIINGICYITVGGSTAYGTASADSDIDLIGIYIPPRENLYPQDYGYIQGFDGPKEAVETHQVHHIYIGEQEYDLNLFNIIKFFKLAAAGNPNIVDAISTKAIHHRYRNDIGDLIYQNRKMFLSKDMYPKFRGMIKNHMATIAKAQTGHGHANLIQKFGYDTKDAAHSIRVLFGLVDILSNGDYSIDAHADVIRDIRGGMYSLADMLSIYEQYNEFAEQLVVTSKIQETVDRAKVKQLLQQCIDMHHMRTIWG